MASNNICFNSNSILFCILIFFTVLFLFIYNVFYKFSNYLQVKSEANNKKNIPEKTKTEIELKQPILISDRSEKNDYLPERRYIGNNDFSFKANQVGFIYNNEGRYPLYETRRGRNFHYHVVDNERSQNRIPLDISKNDQLNDKQEISVPELNSQSLKVKLYDYAGHLYNPFLY